ncbi:MAG: aminotransferase class IV [Patescibacteria group bacterium]
MELCDWIWINGTIVHKKERILTPSLLFTHAMQYGISAFEGIRFYQKNGQTMIFRLKEHLERLTYSAKEIFIENAENLLNPARITCAIEKTIRRNKIKEGYIRPWIGYTTEKLGLDLRGCKASVVIGIVDWPAYYKGALKVHRSSIARPHPNSFPMNAKIGGMYVNSVRASMEAKGLGFDEAILPDINNFVGEASAANVFVIKNRTAQFSPKIYTPRLGLVLPGITRDTIIQISKHAKISTQETEISFAKNYDEMFVCGTAAEVVPVTHINNEPIGDGKVGPTTKKLRKLYKRVVRGELKKFRHWITYID